VCNEPFAVARRFPRCHPEPTKRGKEPPVCHSRAIRRRNRGLQLPDSSPFWKAGLIPFRAALRARLGM